MKIHKDYHFVSIYVPTGIKGVTIDVHRAWRYNIIQEKNVLDPAVINWPAIGFQSPRQAQQFGLAIIEAVNQAGMLNQKTFRRLKSEEHEG